MEFDRDRVYQAFEADELKIGSTVILADTVDQLKRFVNDIEFVTGLEPNVFKLECIQPECFPQRFSALNRSYNFAYLISEPEEKKLKWTDLKRGNWIRSKTTGIEYMVIVLDKQEDKLSHIGTVEGWINDCQLGVYEKIEE